MSHTPGPWTWSVSSASVNSKFGTVVYGDPDNPNCFDDARLIAAAPDLLAAAKHYIAVHDQFDGVFPDGEWVIGFRAAIAKAEGR